MPATYNISLNRLPGKDFLFEGTNEKGATILIDNSTDGGGDDLGPQPMQVVLMALAGCSGIDVLSILKKSKQTVDTLQINVEAERVQNDGYASFGEICVHYVLTGDVGEKKLRRAIELSQTKYCSVAMLLKAGATIRATATLNETELGEIVAM